MIQLHDLEKIHDQYAYACHGESLLKDESIYWQAFQEWVTENDSVLKDEYIRRLRSNDNEIMDDPYLSWTMQKYVIWDYNKLIEEINHQTGQ